jgi:VWFA-related protein
MGASHLPSSYRSKLYLFKNSALMTTNVKVHAANYRRAMAVAFFSLFATTALSQTGPSEQSHRSSSIKLRTSLVIVPAIVTNHAGARISDLGQDNFKVFENGQIQKIAFFHHIQGLQESAAPQTLAPGEEISNGPNGAEQNSALLVWDLLNSTTAEQSNGRDELMKFLSTSSVLSEPICLVAFDSSGVWLIHDFTRDPALLAESLKAVKGHRPEKGRPKTNPLESTFRNVQGWHTASANRSIAALQGREDVMAIMTTNQASDLSWRTWITLEALRVLGEAYAGIPGRKSLIWATGGFPFDFNDPSHFSQNERALLPYYENVWRILNRANIAVYPLDVEDLENPGFVDPRTGDPLPEHFASPSNVSNLESFADATGGRLCDRQTSALGCITNANNDANDYYMIGFYQSGDESKPGWRTLSVKVDRADVQVRARSGYYAHEPQDENDRKKEDIELALASPLDFTALRISVRLTTNTQVSGKTRVGFAFVIPPGAVTIDDTDNGRVSLDFAAVAKDPEGANAGTFSQNLSGHLKADNVTALQTQGAAYPASIDLSSGSYFVRFVVRDNVSGQIGSASASVKVP